ncbi:uncharacterized protein LOC110463736 isoform X4 [Mizuhopecten yessoensis]|uniref:Endonuclease/exonuclease/phosphatase domain-containing protein n=5 Tax=Mizuhopecten yessoensis TaxID=6573 RepID=A0A210PVL4_MIZYE|nr:uncharacterized protein LOC110463736 isoform X3 [Mizuhopecten yessoensis]XP_021374234.1 uncharacterized protein LOC110463736 isoform X4 [Mizuhopecten yessoensis]OWF40506.1 hypothetical protein KP79_PYT19048 [Mizuhopecten yessoensis]
MSHHTEGQLTEWTNPMSHHTEVAVCYNVRMSTKLFLLCLCCVRQLQGIKIVTYNTALIDSNDFYAERKPEIISAIQTMDYDVLCLQEVFYGNDVIEIEENHGSHVKSFKIPLTQETDSEGAKAPPCAAAARNGTLNCVFTQCATLPLSQFVKCSFETCRADLISQACLSCLTYDARKMEKRCILDKGAINPSGLMLLSKRKVLRVQYNYFEDPDLKLLFKRAYISAKIAGVGTVICTHTTAFLGPAYAEYTLRDQNIYSSWAEQNLAESMKLTALAKTNPSRAAIIVGDLNAGPAVPTDIAPLIEASYQHFINEGFTSPYVHIDGRCTYCSANPLAPTEVTQNFVIDHVFIKSDSHVVYSCRRSGRNEPAAQRFLEEIISSAKPYPRSDHFAVRVDIVPLRRRKRKIH